MPSLKLHSNFACSPPLGIMLEVGTTVWYPTSFLVALFPPTWIVHSSPPLSHTKGRTLLMSVRQRERRAYILPSSSLPREQLACLRYYPDPPVRYIIPRSPIIIMSQPSNRASCVMTMRRRGTTRWICPRIPVTYYIVKPWRFILYTDNHILHQFCSRSRVLILFTCTDKFTLPGFTSLLWIFDK